MTTAANRVLAGRALFACCVAALPPFSKAASPGADTKSYPNIVYVLADDLGYGDVQCLNPQRGKIRTPHIDRLAAAGMVFREAHSSSSVCTPTRYGILTGRYNWRSRLQSGVLGGSSQALIDPGRLTVPKLLQQNGYTTACIGKWHLGMTLPQGLDTGKFNEQSRITDGPTTRGFDTYFGITASLDMPPFAFIENDRFTEAPTATKTWVRTGPAAPGFEAVDVLPTLTRKAVEFISKTRTPFFLYLPLNAPHTPILPTKEWQGKSGLGAYGDFVMETDWALGEVLKAIDLAGIADNTLVIFTSDNGCSPAAGIPELENHGHFPSESRRGYKADIFDGGHRVPFIVRWPGKVKPGTLSDELIGLTDLMATCADIVGATLPDNAGEDSVSLLPVWLGTSKMPIHEAIIHHSINGSFAIRQGNWKLELCADSGGWSSPKPGSKDAQGLPSCQLYDMSKDIGERVNECQEHPDIVTRLTTLLEQAVARGRTTPGAPQPNDVDVEIRKHRSEDKTPASTTRYPPHMDGARVEPYKTLGDTPLNLYIFSPPDSAGTNARPAIVFYFGGGWHSGTPGQFESQCRHFANLGMVAITADYRVASRHHTKPVQSIADARSAIRWVRGHAAHLGIDPNRIAAGGGSAGGHLAACTAFINEFDELGEDQRIRATPDALVLFNPVLALAPMEGLKPEGFVAGLSETNLGAKPIQISPAHHIRAGAPPVIIFHGRADKTVPFATAERFAAEMRAAGNRCELIGFEGQSHGFFNRDPWLTQTLAQTDKFLDDLGWLRRSPPP